MRWIIMTCILMTCLLGGCSQKENVDNSYFEENYEISETTLNLKSLSLNAAFSIQEQDKQSNFILIIIREGCAYSKQFLQEFVEFLVI